MNCEECRRLKALFRESAVFADRAQTELRCYFLLHPHSYGVSDLAEYESLAKQERRTTDERERAYAMLAAHRKGHS
jgi:hypothetical protein